MIETASHKLDNEVSLVWDKQVDGEHIHEIIKS
jgi:hypothetical protein